MDTFGEWLRQQRSHLRLTREQLAARVGCSVALLRKIEDGERRPSAQIAELMANCLDILPAERATFVRVARGELSVDRLAPLSQPIAASTVLPASTATRRSILPVLPTPLIGRQHEVAELSQLLRDPPCRLLTLVGPGGIGKTRLALEAASQVQDDFADGVYFVPLAPVISARYLVPVIADALGLAFASASRADPKAQLFSYLKEKQVLLLLDNLEQLLAEPGIELLADLLADAPHVKLLATSREALGLQGEWVFEVQGLPIPDGRDAAKAQNTSVELFLQRARRAHVRFTATPEDYSAIVRICQLVGGMPLGIELAAAWVRTLTCAEIASEIERGVGFLSAAARDLPTRHRSLRTVFDHSWQLLTPEEQGVLFRLAVFRGGFGREAAEAVAGATLSTLSTLVTKSLIRRSSVGRYELHEVIRQFAAKLLAEHPEEQSTVEACHGRYYLLFFSQADGRLRSAAQREALAELTAEMDNFRAAWEWAVECGEFALIEQTLRTLGMFYHTRGWWQEGIDVLGRAIAALETAGKQSAHDRTNQIALGHSLATHSLLASRMGLYEQAQAMLERSLNILRPLHELQVLVEPIAFLGLAMEYTGNYARASELYSEGLEIAKAIGDRWFAALCFTLLTSVEGITQSSVGLEVTHARFQSAVTDWRAIGDPTFTAVGLSNLSRCALDLGRYDEARAALEESVRLCISVGERWELGFVYRGLGLVAQAQGEHQQALGMFRKSLDTLTDLGARHEMARVLAEMSRSIFELGNDAEAERTWRASLRMATETQGTFIVLEALVGVARLQAKRSDREHALELVWRVLHHPASLQETKNRANDLRAELETQLTSQQIEAAWARAQAKPFEVVVGEFLGQD